jgi:drug/metabolite transporter (DMT)-like permease
MNRRLWLGSALALASAVSFALNVPFVSLVYEHGGNIQAVNLVRPWFFLVCALAWVLARRTSLSLSPRQRYASLAIGFLFCVEFYATHSAIRFVPVGLAILIMYTYPLMVALCASALHRRAPSARLVLALLVALAGLSLALLAPVSALDWRGISFAFLAALGMMLIVIVSERALQGDGRGPVLVHAFAFASLIVLVPTLLGAPAQWPTDLPGITALATSTGLYTIATFLLFGAVGLIGPVRFAAIDNTSPLWATLFGFLLLGETLRFYQGAGAILVIAGVTAAQRFAPPIALARSLQIPP